MSRFAFLLVIFFTLVGLQFFFRDSSNVPPSDDEVRQIYINHKDHIELLKNLIVRKNIEYITKDRINEFYVQEGEGWMYKERKVSFDEITSKTGLTPGDWSDFYKLLVNSKIHRIWKHQFRIENKSCSYIEFNVWDESNPPFMGSWLKSIVFSSDVVPGELKETTIVEQIRSSEIHSPRDILRVCSNLENNWFIMFYRYGNTHSSFQKQIHLK